jgi:precorrin-3B synthase
VRAVPHVKSCDRRLADARAAEIRVYGVPVPARARADACPGVFTPHDAADGALARVRLPGGRVTAAQLRVLAGCADDLGDGGCT